MTQPVIILAGAGMSAESGLPTYRGVDGIYKEDPANFNNPWSYRDSAEIRQTFRERTKIALSAKPHKGYEAVAALSDVFVVTTNVDGLFVRAGVAPNRIWEMHGSLEYNQCQHNCQNEVFPDEHCPHCGVESRPAVCMFSDPFWCDVISREQRKLFDAFLSSLKETPIIIEIGVGTAIPTLRLLAAKIAKEWKTEVVRINRDENGLSAEKELIKLFA